MFQLSLRLSAQTTKGSPSTMAGVESLETANDNAGASSTRLGGIHVTPKSVEVTTQISRATEYAIWTRPSPVPTMSASQKDPVAAFTAAVQVAPESRVPTTLTRSVSHDPPVVRQPTQAYPAPAAAMMGFWATRESLVSETCRLGVHEAPSLVDTATLTWYFHVELRQSSQATYTVPRSSTATTGRHTNVAGGVSSTRPRNQVCPPSGDRETLIPGHPRES